MKESALLNRHIVFSVSLKRLNDRYLIMMSLLVVVLWFYNDHNEIRNDFRSQFG